MLLDALYFGVMHPSSQSEGAKLEYNDEIVPETSSLAFSYSLGTLRQNDLLSFHQGFARALQWFDRTDDFLGADEVTLYRSTHALLLPLSVALQKTGTKKSKSKDSSGQVFSQQGYAPLF